MALSASVEKLSVRHEAILHFMLANPTVPLSAVAAHFGYTQAWLSCIINSEAFLEARANYTDIAFHETVLPLREKMVAAANKALDRMNELLPVETDLDVVRKTAADVLSACGFSSSKPAPAPGLVQNNVQNNYNFGNASPEVLARAREKIGVKQTNEPVQLVHISPSGRTVGGAENTGMEESGGVDNYPPSSNGIPGNAIHDGAEVCERRGNGTGNQLDSDRSDSGQEFSTEPRENFSGSGTSESSGRGRESPSGEGEINPSCSSANLHYPKRRLPSRRSITSGLTDTSRRPEIRLHGPNW